MIKQWSDPRPGIWDKKPLNASSRKHKFALLRLPLQSYNLSFTVSALGVNALQNTEVWLKRNFDKLAKQSEDQQSAGANASGTSSVPTPANVMIEAYLEVFEWPDPKSFPEVKGQNKFKTYNVYFYLS